jgi:hypothetical protein
LEEHGADCITGRFDALPIHQSCSKLNTPTNNSDTSIINDYFRSLQEDNVSASLQVDIIMGMTPQH